MRALHRRLRLLRRAWVGCANIERQDDVRAQLRLDLHDAFRRKHVRRAIQVRLKSCAVLAQFAQVAQAKDLEAAAIGKYGPIPVRKRVQTPKLRNQRGEQYVM